MSFSFFSTESGYDYVSIYTCDCESSSQRILRQSGSLSSSNMYSSTTGFLKVTFTSDGGVTYSGFTGEWSLSGTSDECSSCPAGKYASSGASAAAQPSFPRTP